MFGKRRNKDIKSEDNAGPPFLQEGDLPSLTIMSFQQINLVTNNINKNISLDFALLTLVTVATPSDLPVWEGKQNKPENCRRKSSPIMTTSLSLLLQLELWRLQCRVLHHTEDEESQQESCPQCWGSATRGHVEDPPEHSKLASWEAPGSRQPSGNPQALLELFSVG